MRNAVAMVTSVLLAGLASCSTGSDSPDATPDGAQMYQTASELIFAGGEVNLREAIDVLGACIEAAPDDAACHAGLARAYVAIGPNYNILSPAESRDPARQAAERAVQLAPDLAEAHLAMAEVLGSHEWDWVGAEREYRRAMELAPDDVNVLIPYGWYLVGTGRTEEASAALDRMQELQPGISDPQLVYLATGDAARAEEAAGALIAADPENPGGYWARANIRAAEGDYAGAVADLERQIPLMEGDVVDEVALLGHVRARMGDAETAREMLARLDEVEAEGRYVSPVNRAWVHAGLGEVDQAISLLSRGLEGHDHRLGLDRTGFAYVFEGMSDDPRFRTIWDELQVPGGA